MRLLRSIIRGVEKAGKSLIKYTSPLGSALVNAHDGRKAARAANKEQAVQRGMIAQEADNVQVERAKTKQERKSVENKVTAGTRRANRRRVRGGLFGDANVDNNTSPRLG